MIKCPKCGTEIISAIKSRQMSVRRQNELADAKVRFSVRVLECPVCKAKFRSRARLTAGPAESPNMIELVERIYAIREGLTNSLNALREKIKKLEKERSYVLAEVEELKKDAESRATFLEEEIKQLREEIESLKELLGSNVGKDPDQYP